ncbi:MAG TPA: hypothetical protein VK489_07935 [Ferruginibacter sp.]|nr:hypothetical protein [Ferruginibacter sp.]
MKRSASIPLILALMVLSVIANNSFAGKLNETHPKNFIAVTAEDRAILYWTMPKEGLTSHFVVEHSVDGSLFVSLDTIAAEENNNYWYTHEHAASNLVNYYRLKQLNKNGGATYSLIRVVRFAEKNMSKVETTTNAITDALQLTVANKVKLVIKNTNNKTIYKKTLHPGQHKLSTSTWAAGRYDLSVYVKGKLVEKKSVFRFATVAPEEMGN